MKERSVRLRLIKKVIKNNRIESQEHLLDLLGEEGFGVTQATLSRDLKYLKVGKISDGRQGYYYALPGEEQKKESERNYADDFLRGYIGLEFSGNLGVVKTLPGHANSVALALDNLDLKDLLGTIAGDDTILLVLREGTDAEVFSGQLKSKIPDLEEI